MLTIRFSRVGKKNFPTYRLIISEKARDPYGKALEILGSYNPHSKELVAKAERIKYWLSKGAGMSPTVTNLLIDKKIIEGEKARAAKTGKKKKADKKSAEKKPEVKVEPASVPQSGTTDEVKPASASDEATDEVKPASASDEATDEVKEEKPVAEKEPEQKETTDNTDEKVEEVKPE